DWNANLIRREVLEKLLPGRLRLVGLGPGRRAGGLGDEVGLEHRVGPYVSAIRSGAEVVFERAERRRGRGDDDRRGRTNDGEQDPRRRDQAYEHRERAKRRGSAARGGPTHSRRHRGPAGVGEVLGRVELVTVERGDARERLHVHRRGEGSRPRFGRHEDDAAISGAAPEHLEEDRVAGERSARRNDEDDIRRLGRVKTARRVKDRRVAAEVDDRSASRCRLHGHVYTSVASAAAPAATRSSAFSGTSEKTRLVTLGVSGPMRAAPPRASPTIFASAFGSASSASGTPTKSHRSGGCALSLRGRATISAHTRASSSRVSSRAANASRPRPNTRVPTTRRSRTIASAVTSAPTRTTPASAMPDAATSRARA